MNSTTMNAVSPTSLPAAGFWHRYAAWSLDFAVLATLAAALAWSPLQRGWHAIAAAATQLSAHAGQAMADALLSGTSPQALSQALLHDAGLHDAAAALQAGLGQMLLPWLLAYALLAAAWHIGGELSRWQGSPGKRALRLVVTDLEGRPPTLARAATRHVAGALSWLTLNLGHALAALPPQKRALHDWIAGTRVTCSDGDPRQPGWASAWIALQVVAGVALAAWLLLRYVAALQAATLAG
jgi:uncharacterized RDD family membrane protein YckC